MAANLKQSTAPDLPSSNLRHSYSRILDANAVSEMQVSRHDISFPRIRAYVASEAGAVTVDWLVLTAVLTTLSLSVAWYVKEQAEDVSESTQEELSDFASKLKNGDWP
ncbi:hypothetical protein [Tranquillimonas rosea]|uniref:hypothetical protein n=1 Tax=Tranquillimonas rosea TaxID=641238 RepID=UPI003BA96F09